MNPRKITIAAGIFPPDIGGPATYVVKLAEALIRKDWRVNVVCYSSQNDKQVLEEGNSTLPVAGVRGFEVYRILRKGSFLSRYWRYFWHVVKVSRDVDVIYAQGPISAGLPALFAAKLLRKKFVVKVVGDPAWEQAMGKGLVKDMIDEFQVKKYGGRVKRLKKIRSFVCKRADKVITPSKYLAGIVRGWGVDGGRVVVVYNAIEDAKIEDGRLKMDEDVILSVARLVKWKGIDTLIALMPELVKINPKFKLIILGDGPEKENYQLSIINYQLQDKVKLLGKVSHEKVFEYLQSAKMFVLNTGYEGLPHIVLEAMQAGCPVITTSVGGNPEVIRDGENGLLVEYNNKEQLKSAILRLLGDDSLRPRLVEQAKKDLGKFNFIRMIDETENVINKLINQ